MSRLLVRALVALVGLAVAVYLRRRYLSRGGRGADDSRRRGIANNNKKKPSSKCTLFVESIVAQGSVDMLTAFDLFPKKFERHDHVVVVTLNPKVAIDQFAPYAAQFALCFTPAVDVVIVDTDGIAGELRQPVHEVVYTGAGALQSASRIFRSVERSLTPADKTLKDALSLALPKSPTYTLHIEKGVKYSFDAMRVMFCSGNTTERMHFGGAVRCPGETVVDMFAGIGYFTLPLSLHGGLRHLYAMEKNHDSVQYLQANLALNGVRPLVTVIEGDNREDNSLTRPLLGGCDRVLMGYIPTCAAFIGRALQFLRIGTDGAPHGVIHYHCLAESNEHAATVTKQDFDVHGGVVATAFEITDMRSVKSYSPKKYHYVVDVRF